MRNVLPFYQREGFIYFFAILTSLLLSAGIDFFQPIVNPDAICYLGSAKAIGTMGLKAATHLCPQANWPFYSMVIFSVVKLTHLPYPIAGYAIDAIFSAISVLLFIMIVKRLGGSRNVMWLAAAIILLSHEFNDVREYIVRDHGFWVFYLLSVYLLLDFFAQPKFLTGIAWSLSLAIATLFRIEGAVFLILLPFMIWLNFSFNLRERAKSFLILNLPLIGFCVVLSVLSLIYSQERLNQLGRLPEISTQIKHGIMMIAERYETTKWGMTNYILFHEKAKNADMLLPVVLSVYYLFNIVISLSFIYAVIVFYTLLQRVSGFTRHALLVIGGYLLVNFAVTSVFFLENLFLSKRYLVAVSLILMLFVPFGLNDILQKSNKQFHYRIGLWVISISVFLTSLGGIFDFGYSKSYIGNAGKWIADNVPANASLYVNDYQLMYHAHFFGDDLFDKFKFYSAIATFTNNNWKRFDYLALRINKHESQYMMIFADEVSKQKVLARFANKRGDKVVIYKVDHDDLSSKSLN